MGHQGKREAHPHNPAALAGKNFTFFLDFFHEFQPKRVYNITGSTDKIVGRRYLWLIQHRESFRLNLHKL
jgi:hypothetical protein